MNSIHASGQSGVVVLQSLDTSDLPTVAVVVAAVAVVVVAVVVAAAAVVVAAAGVAAAAVAVAVVVAVAAEQVWRKPVQAVRHFPACQRTRQRRRHSRFLARVRLCPGHLRTRHEFD